VTRPAIRITPAILSDDPEKIRLMLSQACSFTDWVQIDLMDGQFVPSYSIAPETLKDIHPQVGWEAHMMVLQPALMLEDLKSAGASRAIFHYEATRNPEAVIGTARSLGLDIGIALNPATPVEEIKKMLPLLDCVLIMSVNPGFYGAPFVPESLEKVSQLRKLDTGIEIGIDGGIKQSNISSVSRSGVNSICVGSAIFLEPDPAASYARLVDLVKP
jgi:ribulose-phosphate 3-epimerase